MNILAKIFGRNNKVLTVEEQLPLPNKVDICSLPLDSQMRITHKWETAVWHMFKIGTLIETTDDIPFMFCSGPDTYFDTKVLPSGTKFVVKEHPVDNEGGFYHCLVLADGREAIVDLYQFYGRAKIV